MTGGPFVVSWSHVATGGLTGIPREHAVRIDEKTLDLAFCEDPYVAPSVKRLRGVARAMARLRVGDYRVIFEVGRASRTIFILSIAGRDDVYR